MKKRPSKPVLEYTPGRKADYAGASPEQTAKAVLTYKPSSISRSDSKKTLQDMA